MVLFRKTLLIALLASSLLSYSAMAAQKKAPLYSAPSFQPTLVSEITIIAVDVRVDKEKKADTTKDVRGPAAKILKKKGYTVTESDDLGGVQQITDDDIRDADASWIKQVGPAGARWVIVVALVDVTSKTTFGSTGNAVVSSAIFDKSEGIALWRNKGVGKAGQGGLLGIAMKGAMSGAAVGDALEKLFEGLSDHKVTKKK